jgi:riboflavin synthase
MFTGIIETVGAVKALQKDKENLHITISSPISDELKIDQSVSHDGVCLTVVEKGSGTHTVTAISETLKKSGLGKLEVGSLVNLERAMKMGDRLDGHIVQGHVDTTAECTGVVEDGGSWYYSFKYNATNNVTIEKGSISINGVSLTVVDSEDGQFKAAIIPYTYEHTNFQNIQPGTLVNLEFDMIGKYVERLTRGYL